MACWNQFIKFFVNIFKNYIMLYSNVHLSKFIICLYGTFYTTFIYNFCSLSQHDKYESRDLCTVEHYTAGICRMYFSSFFLFLLSFFPLIVHSKLCTNGVLSAQCHFFPASLANVFQLTCHTVGNYQCPQKNMFCLTDV